MLLSDYKEKLSPFFYSEARLAFRDLEVLFENEPLKNELELEGSLVELALDDKNAIAQSYSGMQFGHFTTLGDGRALLLGEVKKDKDLFDVVLKGSGRTPYSRGGDGKASLSPMLREYLISEAMHYLGVPTSRSLAVFKTGDMVFRERPEEGALLIRIMKSHIRVGTFQHAYYRGGEEKLEELLTYTKDRLYKGVDTLTLLKEMVDRQAFLIAQWMSLGFIHGVLNTDNVSLSGEGFDYGPCAFLDTYEPERVFSSIDTMGRYAFMNQVNIGLWNLARFAETLLDSLKEEGVSQMDVEETLLTYEECFNKHFREAMGKRLGFNKTTKEDDALIKELLDLLRETGVDYHNFFLDLEEGKELPGKFNEWRYKWSKRKDFSMKNPRLIPRNHLVDKALKNAANGDFTLYKDLLTRVRKPYDDVETFYQTAMPEEMKKTFRTYCGT